MLIVDKRESGQKEEVQSVQTNTQVSTTKVKKQEDVDKPRLVTSTLEIVACLNYLVCTGDVVANNKIYISFVNNYKSIHKKPLAVKITKCDNKTIYAGDNPDVGNNTIIDTYFIVAPVMINLAFNTLGARAIKSTVKESRRFKLSISEQFALTENDYKSVIEKLTKLEGSEEPMPTTEDIQDFKWLEPSGDKQYVHTPKRASSAAKEKGIITGENTTNKIKPILSAEELVRRVSKGDKKTGDINRPTSLKTDDSFKPVKINKYMVYLAEENCGIGYFNYVYFDEDGEKVYFTIEMEDENTFKLIFQNTNNIELFKEELVLFIIKSEYTGESIHSVKTKKNLMYNVSNYRVYRK